MNKRRGEQGAQGVQGIQGVQGDPGGSTEIRSEAIHRWRWRGLVIWIIVFTVLVFIAIRSNRQAVDQIKRDKASIHQLEQTNCALKQFLLTAAQARKATANDPKVDPSDRETAKQAYLGYVKLARLFPPDGCKHALRGH